MHAVVRCSENYYTNGDCLLSCCVICVCWGGGGMGWDERVSFKKNHIMLAVGPLDGGCHGVVFMTNE